MTTLVKPPGGGRYARKSDGSLQTLRKPTEPRTKEDWDRERNERNRQAEPKKPAKPEEKE